MSSIWVLWLICKGMVTIVLWIVAIVAVVWLIWGWDVSTHAREQIIIGMFGGFGVFSVVLVVVVAVGVFGP